VSQAFAAYVLSFAACSRLVGVNKNTVVRYCLRAGGHAQQLHDELSRHGSGRPRA
jgi:hypothetical protein